MMKLGKQVVKSHMTVEFSFMGIRLTDGCLTPVTWELEADIIGQAKKGKAENAEYNAGLAYQKIHFWLETNLPDVIMVNACDADDLLLANMSANITMYCPGDTGDNTIIQLIHAKLSSLMGNDMLVGEMRLKGSDISVRYTYDYDGAYMLPATAAEYCLDDVITRDELPWWFRDDGFCFEFVRPNDVDISNDEFFADIIDPMVEFDKVMAEVVDMHVGHVREPARIVQVEKWKPKMVD